MSLHVEKCCAQVVRIFDIQTLSISPPSLFFPVYDFYSPHFFFCVTVDIPTGYECHVYVQANVNQRILYFNKYLVRLTKKLQCKSWNWIYTWHISQKRNETNCEITDKTFLQNMVNWDRYRRGCSHLRGRKKKLENGSSEYLQHILYVYCRNLYIV